MHVSTDGYWRVSSGAYACVCVCFHINEVCVRSRSLEVSAPYEQLRGRTTNLEIQEPLRLVHGHDSADAGAELVAAGQELGLLELLAHGREHVVVVVLAVVEPRVLEHSLSRRRTQSER